MLGLLIPPRDLASIAENFIPLHFFWLEGKLEHILVDIFEKPPPPLA